MRTHIWFCFVFFFLSYSKKLSILPGWPFFFPYMQVWGRTQPHSKGEWEGHCISRRRPWFPISRCKHVGRITFALIDILLKNMSLHIDFCVVNATRKTPDIRWISHLPPWGSGQDTKANIWQNPPRHCLPIWFTAVIGLGWTYPLDTGSNVFEKILKKLMRETQDVL